MVHISASVTFLPIFLLVLTWLFVALRVYVRARIIRSIGADDYTCIAALLGFTAFVGCILATARYEGQAALKACLVAEILYGPALALVKVSIGLLLLRLCFARCPVTVVRILIGVNTIVGMVSFFVLLLQCRPTSYWWSVDSNANGKCINPGVISTGAYVFSGISALSDWMYAVMPILWVCRTKMNMRSKISVSMLLGFASVASIATLLRIQYIPTLNQRNKSDYVSNIAPLGLWSMVEIAVGISTSCISTLRPLFQNFFDNGKGDSTGRSDQPTSPAMGRCPMLPKPSCLSTDLWTTRSQSAGDEGTVTTEACKRDEINEKADGVVVHTKCMRDAERVDSVDGKEQV